MSSYNPPDEAERLLNEIIFAATRLESADSYQAELGAITRMEKLRSQLLPLIRSGLALQRLEKAIDDANTSMNICRGEEFEVRFWPPGYEYKAESESLTVAINAALDPAGVEK